VMGMAVFAGMLIATMLAVCLIPVLFVIVEKLGAKKKQGAGEQPATLETAPARAPAGGH
jgi:hydrophobic/amphiphilic exporter-1 (mainly G- bacteria), HAE1 family